MKVMVTGRAGYIGAVVTDQLINRGHEVVVDDLSAGYADALPPSAILHRIGISQITDVPTAGGRFDAVLHFAARIGAGESVQRPDLYWQTNVAGSLALLAAIRNAGPPTRVQFHRRGVWEPGATTCHRGRRYSADQPVRMDEVGGGRRDRTRVRRHRSRGRELQPRAPWLGRQSLCLEPLELLRRDPALFVQRGSLRDLIRRRVAGAVALPRHSLGC
jgi:hypothetical protein